MSSLHTKPVSMLLPSETPSPTRPYLLTFLKLVTKWELNIHIYEYTRAFLFKSPHPLVLLDMSLPHWNFLLSGIISVSLCTYRLLCANFFTLWEYLPLSVRSHTNCGIFNMIVLVKPLFLGLLTYPQHNSLAQSLKTQNTTEYAQDCVF